MLAIAFELQQDGFSSPAGQALTDLSDNPALKQVIDQIGNRRFGDLGMAHDICPGQRFVLDDGVQYQLKIVPLDMNLGLFGKHTRYSWKMRLTNALGCRIISKIVRSIN
jgi:hypothetical protein